MESWAELASEFPVFRQAGSREQTSSSFVYGLCSCSASVWSSRVASRVVRAPVCVIFLGSKEKMHENVFRRPGDRTHASYDHDQEGWGWDLWGS